MVKRMLATKPLAQIQAEAVSEHGFKRALSTFDLTLLGVGVAVGSGIFVLTGHAAAHNAGPAVVVAFLLAALGAGLGSLCYAEMASMLPVSGSAYAYAYATLGELVGFLIGWDLMLEYMVGAATVSSGWSGYAVALVQNVTGYELPARWVHAPFAYDPQLHSLQPTGSLINLPAVFIIALITAILVRGVRGSSRVNAFMVLLKTAAVLGFVVVCAQFVEPRNWHPFVPPNAGPGMFGWSGVLQGASLVFFAYLGIDNLTTAALEAKDPQRSLPRAIMFTLLLCTGLYVAFALVLTGVVPYHQLTGDHPAAVATAVTGMPWLETLVELGATAGLTSVILVQLYGQPRILFAMSKDGLLPPFGHRMHRRFGTPHVATLLSSSICALGAGLMPVELLAELCSVGTLFAFILVSAGVLLLRVRQPDLPRRFRIPFGNVIPIASMVVCTVLMRSVSSTTLWRLFGWLAAGLTVYLVYGVRNSKLRAPQVGAGAAEAVL